jgi:hypothetical protein
VAVAGPFAAVALRLEGAAAGCFLVEREPADFTEGRFAGAAFAFVRFAATFACFFTTGLGAAAGAGRGGAGAIAGSTGGSSSEALRIPAGAPSTAR